MALRADIAAEISRALDIETAEVIGDLEPQ